MAKDKKSGLEKRAMQYYKEYLVYEHKIEKGIFDLIEIKKKSLSLCHFFVDHENDNTLHSLYLLDGMKII